MKINSHECRWVFSPAGCLTMCDFDDSIQRLGSLEYVGVPNIGQYPQIPIVDAMNCDASVLVIANNCKFKSIASSSYIQSISFVESHRFRNHFEFARLDCYRTQWECGHLDFQLYTLANSPDTPDFPMLLPQSKRISGTPHRWWSLVRSVGPIVTVCTPRRRDSRSKIVPTIVRTSRNQRKQFSVHSDLCTQSTDQLCVRRTHERRRLRAKRIEFICQQSDKRDMISTNLLWSQPVPSTESFYWEFHQCMWMRLLH